MACMVRIPLSPSKAKLSRALRQQPNSAYRALMASSRVIPCRAYQAAASQTSSVALTASLSRTWAPER